MTKLITTRPTTTTPARSRPSTDEPAVPETGPGTSSPSHDQVGYTTRLIITPITLRTARAFIAWTHRHLPAPVGAKFAIGVSTEDRTLVGVVTVGRPVARALDDGLTIEVTRLATDGTANACSALLGAAWRAARAMGYRRLITYTRSDESGTSLRAAGLHRVAELPPRPGWDAPSRPRTGKGADDVARVRWEIRAGGEGR
jgi:hypothetical protein